jgi:hypothetical protein
VRRKGREAKELRTLCSKVSGLLAAWIEQRGKLPSLALFVGQQDRQRLSGNGLLKIVKQLGEQAGVRARP